MGRRLPTKEENHFYENVKHHRGLNPALLTRLSFIPVQVRDVSLREREISTYLKNAAL